MKYWYLVYSKPRQEKIAHRQLQFQGYTTYLPLTHERKLRDGKRQQVISPLFPRYLFINLCDEIDNWSPIRSTIGVLHLVHFSHILARVPDRLIDGLKANDDIEGIQQREVLKLRKGDKVRILEGSVFEGVEAVFQSYSSNDRIVLLLKIVNQQVEVKMNEALVASAV